MGAFEIITIVVVGLCLIGAVSYLIYKKVKGGGCGCGCSSCPHCSACSAARKKQQDKND